MYKRIAITLCCMLMGLGLFAQNFDANDVLKQIDIHNSVEGDFSAEYTIVSDKPGEERSIFKTQIFRRDDEDKFLLLILEPTLRKGEGYLQVDETGWAYDPESREFAIFRLSDRFQDSESRNSDFADSSVFEDYEVASYEEGKLGKYEVLVLDLEARTDTVAFPKERYWVRKDNYLLLKSESYSLSGRLVRTAYYPSYAQAGTVFVPTKMLFVDNLNPGEKTEVSVRGVRFNDIPDTVFTQNYLEQVNR